MDGDSPKMDTERITMPIAAFCTASGLGRQKTYDLINAGKIESVLVGNRRLVIVSSWHDHLRRLQQEQAGVRLKASPNPRAQRVLLPSAPPVQPRKRGRPSRLSTAATTASD